MEEEKIPTSIPTPSSTPETSGNVDIRALNEKIQRESSFVDLVTMEMDKVIIGQKHMTERTHSFRRCSWIGKNISYKHLSKNNRC